MFAERFTRGAALAARLDDAREILLPAARHDLRAQLNELLGPEGLITWDEALRRHCERYLRAMEIRLERAQREPMKDVRKFEQLAPVMAEFASEPDGRGAAEERHHRYLLQELRVAIFAPELRTAEPVSIARLEQLSKRRQSA
jgi:ATP-dependent helicase HrpA